MQVNPSDYFDSLRAERHISLATFRSNGQAVPTPIWFAAVEGSLYVRTASHFGKLSRVAENPSVTVAACTESGEVTGPAFPAVARILEREDSLIAKAEAALEAKYSDVRPAMTRLLIEQGWMGVYVEIQPPSPESNTVRV